MSAVGLPDISAAKLPQTYEAAKNALAECSRMDECQQWADKAEALASYARQAKDEQLRKMADRIQARAIRRCGELLKLIQPATGRHLPNTPNGRAPSRLEAATAAGLSEHQRKTALRVASVPESDFDAAVESDEPPTVTALAERGKAERLVDLGGIDPAAYRRATEALGTLRRFAEFCSANDPHKIAKAFKPHELPGIRKHVATVDQWLDRLVTSLEG